MANLTLHSSLLNAQAYLNYGIMAFSHEPYQVPPNTTKPRCPYCSTLTTTTITCPTCGAPR